jgi:Flp pilus assembly protein TadG
MKQYIPHPNHQRGVAAVELALLMVVLLPLTFGITEYGRAMYQYNTLVKNARDAVRYLSEQAPGAANHAAAKCIAVYGNTGCTAPVLLPGLTTGMVSVCDSLVTTACPGGTFSAVPTGSGVVNLVTVKISGYTFASLVPAYASSFTFDNVSATMRQY